MNIKMTFVSLSLVLAGSASAQVILPGGRGNIYIGTPTYLPGPVPNIVISPRISLPSPLLAPSVAFVLAPVPMAAAIPVLPVALPSAIPFMPMSLPTVNPGHAEIHQMAIAIQPRALRQISLAAPTADGKVVVPSTEKLEGLFDGRRQPAEKGEDELGPVRSGRHVSLPEHDLESEIGAY